jgi:hypothetical protein
VTLTFKDSTGNYLLDQLYDTKFPAGSLLEGRTGAPAGPNGAAGGSLLFQIVLPATPFSAAASKSKVRSGTWSTAATATGTLGHFRLKNAADTEREEGTVTLTGGGGDMTVDSLSVAATQIVAVTVYTRTA